MQQQIAGDVQKTGKDSEPKKEWFTPALTKLKVEDAESGVNISENGATGS